MLVETRFDINGITHPDYSAQSLNWDRWRLTFESGEEYLNQNLISFSNSEESQDFKERKKISYVPAFAKEAVIEIRNSIYQRMADIKRDGGTRTYRDAVKGLNHGVDLEGSSMNTFMGVEALPELLSMGKVGIYVDMPERRGETLADNFEVRPYLYIYKVEDIRSWATDKFPTIKGYKALLLRDYIYTFNEETGLPIGQEHRYRYYWRDDLGRIHVRFYNKDSQQIDPESNELSDEDIILNIDRIPFIVIDLGESLLKDIDGYQNALMQLASADMSYCRGANFPFYTEQFDPRYDVLHARRAEVSASGDSTDSTPPSQEIKVGVNSGRRYPLGTDRPQFIHPPTAPLLASMEKQAQLKLEIRMLMHLTLSTLKAKMASAESKDRDERPLESGLSYIGLLLEDAERQIGQLWSAYESSKEIPTIFYPSKYSLRTDKDRYEEAEKLEKLSDIVPSRTYKKFVCKEISTIMLGTKIAPEDLEEIHKEIDAAEIVIVKADLINKDVESGILDPERAAEARGYPKDTVKKAQEFRAERLKLIQQSQMPGNPAARGNPDASTDPKQEAQNEKEGSVDKGSFNPNQRGPAQ